MIQTLGYALIMCLLSYFSIGLTSTLLVFLASLLFFYYFTMQSQEPSNASNVIPQPSIFRPKEYNGVTGPGKGLYNPNVLCFMNSILQCLRYSGQLTSELFANVQDNKKDQKNIEKEKWKNVLIQYLNVLHNCATSQEDYVSVTPLWKSCITVMDMVSEDQCQQDAEEFLSVLLEGFHTLLKIQPKPRNVVQVNSIVNRRKKCARQITKATNKNYMNTMSKNEYGENEKRNE